MKPSPADIQRCRDLASWFLQDSDVTNADRPTLTKHEDALALILFERIVDYIADAEAAAPHEKACRCDRCCGTPAYYAQSSSL